MCIRDRYMYYYRSDDLNIIGASPEMLVRMTGQRIETFPIAGTRPRLNNQVKNVQLTKELLADEKENAEHIMLVDLARNDVGQISEYGTVKVPDFRQVHQFSHVQHIVSKVIGNNMTANIIIKVGATRIYPKPLSADSNFLFTFYYL